MSWVENTKVRFKIMAIMIAVMCPVLLVKEFPEMKRQLDTENWPSVEGQVSGPVVKEWLDDEKKVKFYGRVAYTYTVDGKEYATELTELAPGIKRLDRQSALSDVSRYRSGMKTRVYYDPSDPSIGVLERGLRPHRLFLMIGLAAASIIGAVASFFIVSNWLRNRESRVVKQSGR